MNIPFTRRLSFKQASLTVLVAFILGTLLSLLQVSIDYANQEASIDREIHTLLEISRTPATRITYNIDAELAHELVLGLLNSPAIIRAEILDNSGASLASVSRPRQDSRYRPISDFLFGSERQFSLPLLTNHSPQEALGELHLEVDTFAFGSHFLGRALLTMAAGFVRSLLLSLILLVLFYFMLTKPLSSVIRAISERDSSIPGQANLSCPPGHERDEIGVLVEVANAQLHNISKQISSRLAAEERLTQYLSELETVISTRTTELKASNARLTQSNQELEKSRSNALQTAQARAAFLASMSHEIRTPLSGLLGMLALTLDSPLNAQQQQQLSIANESGNVLLELLNDILDLSKIEAGQLQLEQLPFDLAKLAEETASLLSQNAAEDVELTCLIDPQLPSLVLGDPTRVRQIISNLLSNALKFTHYGRVDLRLRATPNGVQICVEDTGIGISAEQQSKIFQPFTQANLGTTRQYGGTGLGLTLTRTLCRAMHGQLSLSSEEQRGSQFCAELPLAQQQAATPPQALHGRVLAVLDERSGLAELLGQLLPSWGLDYQLRAGVLPQAPLDADLLICADPAQLKPLRSQYQGPLVLLCRYGDFLDSEQARQLAPFSQLARPLLRQQLQQLLAQTLQPHAGTLAAPPPSASNAAQAHSRVLLVEDNPVNQLVAKGMLGKLGYQVLLATQGEEALACLAREAVDVVLMDCNMPVMDGYEATRRIRQNPAWHDLPIIALTANAMADERERCRAAGMDDYLAKPFRMEQLAALLKQWLSIKAAP